MMQNSFILLIIWNLMYSPVESFSKIFSERRKKNSFKSSLSMSISSVIESGTAVAGVVAFHEAGHFLAARAYNMKVDSYNVGYGPKLLSFNDSSGIE